MSTVALRQFMVPTGFFMTGLALLAASNLPALQNRSIPLGFEPPAPPATVPLVPNLARQPAAPPFAPDGRPGSGSRPWPNDQRAPSRSTPAVATGLRPVTPDRQIRLENTVTIGRVDPFQSLGIVRRKPILPPPPPLMPFGFVPEMPPAPPVALPMAPPAVPASLRPTPQVLDPALKAGLSLQGMVTSEDEEPAAIVNIDDNTQLVRVGDVIRRQGMVRTVVRIDARNLSVTLSDGRGHQAVLKTD